MKSIKISKYEDVGKVLDFIHDQSFRLSDLDFDKNLGILKIPVFVISDQNIEIQKSLFWERWKNPILRSELIFKNVCSYSIQDNARIGEGIINTIQKDGNNIILKCSVPVLIKIEVSDFALELNMTDEVLRKIKRFRFSWRSSK
jgi:hypothetical protein